MSIGKKINKHGQLGEKTNNIAWDFREFSAQEITSTQGFWFNRSPT